MARPCPTCIVRSSAERLDLKDVGVLIQTLYHISIAMRRRAGRGNGLEQAALLLAPIQVAAPHKRQAEMVQRASETRASDQVGSHEADEPF